MAVFLTGGYFKPLPYASVTVTGTGNSTYCYATINGTKYSGASSNIEVLPGDVITFGVYGRSSTYYGEVTINGTQALKVTSQNTQTYNWTVPDGVKTISISMSYTSSSTQRRGRITVTTTSVDSGGSTPNIIAFTINGISYQVKEGMTWGEWVGSKYDTSNGLIWLESDGTVVAEEDGYWVMSATSSSHPANEYDEIVSGYPYVYDT